MKGHSDLWIKDRILWAAQKNGLPTGMTSFYEDSKCLLPGVRNNANNADIPVLLIAAGENRWTILGTDKIITNEAGTIKEIILDNIKQVRWPSEKDVPVKRDCDFIVIEDYAVVEHRLWVPSGSEFYAIFNILLRLQQLKVGN